MATALPLPSSYKPPAGGLPAVAFASPSDDPSAPKQGIVGSIGSAAKDLSTGLAKAEVGTVQQLGQTVLKGVDAATGIATGGKGTNLGGSTFIKDPNALRSKNTAEGVGNVVGTVAPYLIGAGEDDAVATAPEWAPKLPGIAGKAADWLTGRAPVIAANTAIGTAQTGSLKKGVETGVTASVGQGLLEGAGTLLKGALSDGAESMSATGVATKRVSSTAETMTKAEREAAIKEGRMTPTGSGGKYMPSATEKRAGEILAGKTSSNPVKTVEVINKEIATRGKEAETYLEKAGTKVSNETDLKAFDSARASAEKYMTSAESKAYDEHIGIFQKILKTYTKDGGYTTANYYKALKDYEAQVTANLPKGKEALLKEGGSARLQAAKDVRGVVRDLIGKANPEFKGKMFDLASLYDAQDNVISKAEGLGTFAKRHPLLTKTGIYGAEAIGAGAIYKGAKSLGLPLP
jgi:hypothetical protein